MSMLLRAVPLIFVILWSTGFIGAKLGLPYAEPFTFLTVRMAITLAILLPVVWLFVADRPTPSIIAHSMVSGILIHACYLGAIFFAISRGMSAGISSLIVALQPLLTAFIAWRLLNERMTRRNIVALLVALGGVILVLSPRLAGVLGGHIGQDGQEVAQEVAQGITLINVASCCFAVVAISLGSVYQKRFVPATDLRVSTAAQYFGALIPLAFLSLFFENGQIEWTGEFVFALGWLIIVLSLGAVLLLMFLIRRDSSAKTASLFYLVPVSTAIIAYFLFDEKLVPVQLLGMAIVIMAVASAGRVQRSKQS